MLLSLLPLAGWATIGSIQLPQLNTAQDYTGEPIAALTSAGSASSENARTYHYAVTSSATAPVVDATDWKDSYTAATATDAGTYYVYFMVKTNSDEEGVSRQYVGTFTINKVDPTVTAPGTVDGTVTYNGKAQTLFTFGSTSHGTLKYSLDQETWSETLPQGTNVANYNLYYKVFGDKNHNDKVFGPVSKAIEKKALNTTDFTVTRSASSALYSGVKQDCPYAVTLIVEDGDDVTLASDDYEITYKKSGSDADPVGIGAYVATINAKSGSTNFSGSLTSDNLETLVGTGGSTWTINQYPLTVRALPQSKVYDGNANLPSSDAGTAYQIIGVQNNETVGTPTLAVAGSTVGPQTVTPSALSGDAGVLANYDISYVPSTLTISAIKLEISVDNTNAALSVNKGQNAPNLAGLQATLTLNATDYESDAQPAIVTTQANDIKGAINMTISGVTLGAATTTSGIFDITLATTNADVLNNYDITLSQAGKFTVKGGNIVITTLPKSRTYTESEFNWAGAVKGTDYLVSVDNIDLGVTLSRESGDNKGEYDINATWDAEAVPAYYDGVVVSKGKYTINAATITVTPTAQTLLVGDALDQNAFTASGKKESETWNTIFKLENTTNTYFDANGKALLAAAGTHENEIKVTLLTENYVLSAANTATLTVVNTATDLYLDRDDNRLANTIKAASDACAANAELKYNIRFASRTLNAEQWYAMVLPFQVTVADLSKAFGYAVVDILKEDATDGDVHMTLHMGTIKANQPFIVKVADELNLSSVTTLPTAAISYNATPTASDQGGNTFYGTYSKVEGLNFGANEYYMKNGSFTQNANNITIPAMSAYIKATAGARIFIDEPDGTTTVINPLSAEVKNFSNDGWYTINGVKLNGMPTQKGIYIQNGKKIVVK